MSAAWWMLIIAGIFEVFWAVGLKYSKGFTEVTPSILTAISLIVSMVLLAKATESIPLGTAYAVWVGIGVLGTVVLGILLFGEPLNPLRIFFLGLLLVSIIGLKLA